MGLIGVAFSLVVQGVTFLSPRLDAGLCVCSDANRVDSNYCIIDTMVNLGKVQNYVVLLDMSGEKPRVVQGKVDVGCFVEVPEAE